MPSKNRIKPYVANGYYHIYNRGVEKRLIFHDREDYTKFLYLLKVYLSPVEVLHKEYPLLRTYMANNNLNGEIDLLAFCLMPNHFHLLVHQKSKDTIVKFMRQVMTAYSKYFNKRHERIGPLFQSVYKGALVDSDEYLLHLSRYIHLNPLDRGASIEEFEWSSYQYYLNKKESHWVNTGFISDYFSKKNPDLSYKNFVENYKVALEIPLSLSIEQP